MSSGLTNLLSQLDPMQYGQNFSQKAMADAKIAGQQELARIAQKQNDFNPLNALAAAAAAFATSGGSLLPSLISAAAAPRGERFTPINSVISGVGTGSAGKSLFGGSQNIMEEFGRAIKPQNLSATGSLLSSIPELGGVSKALTATGTVLNPAKDLNSEYLVKIDEKGKKKVIEATKDKAGNLIKIDGINVDGKKTTSDLLTEGFVPSSIYNASFNQDVRMDMISEMQRKAAEDVADRERKPKTVKLANGEEFIATPKEPQGEKVPVTDAEGNVYLVNKRTKDVELLLEGKKQNVKEEDLIRKNKSSKDYQNLESGLSSINSAISRYKKNPDIVNLFGQGKQKLGIGEAGKFATDLKNATDIITRIRTGAALNNEEIDFYNSVFTPKWYNDKSTSTYKMNALKNIFTEAINRMSNPNEPKKNIVDIYNENIPKDTTSKKIVGKTESGLDVYKDDIGEYVIKDGKRYYRKK